MVFVVHCNFKNNKFVNLIPDSVNKMSDLQLQQEPLKLSGRKSEAINLNDEPEKYVIEPADRVQFEREEIVEDS
jgi:hypothetical protein